MPDPTPPETDEPDGGPQVPPTDRTKIVLASICLAIPIIALIAVPTYAKDGPRLWGFPFFFWYQFLWVFLCSGFTGTAYLLVRSARPRPGRPADKRKGAHR